MRFLKEHLRSADYTWINDSIFTGDPSRRLFDRYNGNQLLFIINLYATLTEEFTVDKGLKIEDIIMTQLPLDAKSEISVLRWLKENTLSGSS